MILYISDVSKILNVSEVTITRWVRQGKIPSHKKKGVCTFEKKEIEKWARTHNMRLATNFTSEDCPNVHEDFLLTQSMKTGKGFFDVPGNDVASVLKAAIERCPIPDGCEPQHLLEQLLQREKLVSTSIGQGIAIPHPRYSLGEKLCQPLVTTCFLKKNINFNAVDGQPVNVLFLTLSPNTKTHLTLLSRLSFCLRDNNVITCLNNRVSFEDFIQKIEAMEKMFVARHRQENK